MKAPVDRSDLLLTPGPSCNVKQFEVDPLTFISVWSSTPEPSVFTTVPVYPPTLLPFTFVSFLINVPSPSSKFENMPVPNLVLFFSSLLTLTISYPDIELSIELKSTSNSIPIFFPFIGLFQL